MQVAKLAEIPFTKGHGTANDFVVVPDPENLWHPSIEQIQWLCDRRRGIGADGVIRVVPTTLIPEFNDLGAAEWFMDYRNSDGSLAEMCGNGARVFARYLLASGLVQDREFVIATRAGLHEVIVHSDYSVSVSMGVASFLAGDPTIDVRVDTSRVLKGGRGVLVPNPHAVVFLPENESLTSLDISQASVVPSEKFPEGVNIEFVQRIGERHLAMRVLERGSGETLSCGTGACAVAFTAMSHAESVADSLDTDSLDADPVEWQIDVPGGSLWVRRLEQRLWLRGPAELVARGKVLIPAELL